MTSKPVRTRFAPSPTGYLHVGSARTAFYGWLLARHFGGKFILRVEDTDQERLVPGAIKSLIEELQWFGIEFDEGPSREELAKVGEGEEGAPNIGGPRGPYIQSLRLPRYQEVAEELVNLGVAYRCDCTQEMLEQERLEQMARKESPGYSGYCRDRNVSRDTKHVIRLKVPQRKTISFIDAIKGRVSWEAVPLRDTVILKSDGFPTYHLAVVVDDHDMEITHVLRGDEWLSTTPLHLLIYEALKWDPPIIAHLPVIKGPNGKKLSKREGSVDTRIFRDTGYLAEALLNFVVLIGWSEGDGTEQEIYTRDELIKKFTLERVNTASGVFDYNKLAWMNGTYIRALTTEQFIERSMPFIKKAGLELNQERFKLIAPYVQERVKLLNEVPAMIDFLMLDKIERDLPAMLGKGIDNPKAKELLVAGKDILSGLSDFTHETLEAALRPLAEKFGLKAGPVFGVFRIAVTGKKVTPPLFESMSALGKDIVLKRVDETLSLI